MKIVELILSQMSNVSKPQKKFLITLFATIIMLRGKMNFRNLSRYTENHEKSFSRNFRKQFNFTEFNHLLIMEIIPADNRKIAALDASYIPKSGKRSYGIDHFFSGILGKAKKGQEISSLAIVDLDYNSAYTLSVKQTPPGKEIGSDEENRIDFYLKQIKENQNYLREHNIRDIATDAFYTKSRFVYGLIDLGFNQIGKLRSDANLRYLYTGSQKEGPGRPKTYDGKVYFDDLSRWEFVTELKKDVFLYTAILNYPHLKLNLKVVCLKDQRKSEKAKHSLFFSTDLTLKALDIFNLYAARFQIEFTFRDAKQFTGLNDCQARNKEALSFHFNASLTSLNLLKKRDRDLKKSDSKVCSIASWKSRLFNKHLLEIFISKLELEPTLIKNTPQYEELLNYGAISA